MHQNFIYKSIYIAHVSMSYSYITLDLSELNKKLYAAFITTLL